MTNRRDDEMIRALLECERIVAGGGGLDDCLSRYPSFAVDIREHFSLVSELQALELPGPAPERESAGRSALLTAVAASAQRRSRGASGLKPAAVVAGALVALTLAFGAAAAAGVPGIQSAVESVLDELLA